MVDTKENLSRLWEVGFSTIKELEVERGILASGKDELFGCIFGRDSLITSLALLRVYKKTGDDYFLNLVRKILLNLAELQGKEHNIESGEEPGKCIHEFRPNNHEHLTKSARPWYVYPDNVMRNYDTVDATPLFLVAVHEYYKLSRNEEHLLQFLPSVHAALDWMVNHGDTNSDGFIDYRVHPERTHGGLTVHSWMDSAESLFHEDGTPVAYPIAPVEVQAYAYVALRVWGDYFSLEYPGRSEQLKGRASTLKMLFNEKFVSEEGEGSVAFAIDGNGKALQTLRSNIGHCLWSVLETPEGTKESILETRHIATLAKRLVSPELFEPSAGIRTLSRSSAYFEANSYHNGSIWPHDTSIAIAGLENFGFLEEAKQIRNALLSAYDHFKTPIELFVFEDDQYREYCSKNGQVACKKQAWSAASLLAESATHLYV